MARLLRRQANTCTLTVELVNFGGPRSMATKSRDKKSSQEVRTDICAVCQHSPRQSSVVNIEAAGWSEQKQPRTVGHLVLKPNSLGSSHFCCYNCCCCCYCHLTTINSLTCSIDAASLCLLLPPYFIVVSRTVTSLTTANLTTIVALLHCPLVAQITALRP